MTLLCMWTRYYYRYRIEQLPTCTLTTHGLLHIADGIRYCGPVWSTWTFFMERYCGMLQRSLRSQTQPWSNLNKVLHNNIILEQLSTRYDVTEELAWWDDHNEDGLAGSERTFGKCKFYSDFLMKYRIVCIKFNPDDNHVLHAPFKEEIINDPSLQSRISQYVAAVIGGREGEVKKCLPLPFLFAGRLRIRGGGDVFRTKAVIQSASGPVRRNCYVKVRSLQFILDTGFLMDLIVRGRGRSPEWNPTSPSGIWGAQEAICPYATNRPDLQNP